MVHFKFLLNSRSWMLSPLTLLLIVASPIFAFIAYSLWIGDVGRLFLGGFVLAGYCCAAVVLGKLAIALDEQSLRHLRLKPDGNGRYERLLEAEQVSSPLQVSLELSGEVQQSSLQETPLYQTGYRE